MHYCELQHGDVLLYVHKKHQTILEKLIRLVTGSKMVHSSVVQSTMEGKVILEQLTVRTQSLLDIYPLQPGEELYCYRPLFYPPEYKIRNFQQKPYGVLAILDCLLNHLIGLVIPIWRHKTMLAHWSKNNTCSGLVAVVLNLKDNVDWCPDPRVIEPEDYLKYPHDFQCLGKVEWD